MNKKNSKKQIQFHQVRPKRGKHAMRGNNAKKTGQTKDQGEYGRK